MRYLSPLLLVLSLLFSAAVLLPADAHATDGVCAVTSDGGCDGCPCDGGCDEGCGECDHCDCDDCSDGTCDGQCDEGCSGCGGGCGCGGCGGSCPHP